MPPVPVLDLQAVDERAHERVVERLLPEVVEGGFGDGGSHDDVEALAPRVTAEVVESGLSRRPVDDLLDARRDGRAHESWSPGIERSIIPLADSPSHV